MYKTLPMAHPELCKDLRTDSQWKVLGRPSFMVFEAIAESLSCDLICKFVRQGVVSCTAHALLIAYTGSNDPRWHTSLPTSPSLSPYCLHQSLCIFRLPEHSTFLKAIAVIDISKLYASMLNKIVKIFVIE